MAELLDELQTVGRRAATAVVEDVPIERDIIECPDFLCLRISVVYPNNPRAKKIIEKANAVTDAFGGIDVLTPIEICCYVNGKPECGNVPRWAFTDESVYLCLGFKSYISSVRQIRRFIKAMVQATYTDRYYQYDYLGIMFWHNREGNGDPKKLECFKFYEVEANIFGNRSPKKYPGRMSEDIKEKYEDLVEFFRKGPELLPNVVNV